MSKPRVLDLFSAAAGGWSLGMHRAGYRTVAACESVEWRRALYAINNPGVVLYDDVRTLTADRIVSDLGFLPDIVVGSPPCQDISSANTKGKGVEGERSGLYFEAVRIIGEVRPRWFALENSANLRTRGADAVLAALEGLGYAVWSFVVGADLFSDSPHERKRSWLIGCDLGQNADTDGLGWHAGWQGRRGGLHLSVSHDPLDTPSIGHEGGRPWRYGPDGHSAASIETGVARNASEDGCGQGRTRRHSEPIARLPVEACGHATGNPSDANQAGQKDGLLESSLRPAQEPDDGCGDGRCHDGQGSGQMGGSESLGPDFEEPWAGWNRGPTEYLWVDARLRSWAFLAILLDEGGSRWAGERLIAAVRSASCVDRPFIDADLESALKTVLASYSENTARNLAPIAERLSADYSITLALENTFEAHAKSAEAANASASTTLTKTGQTARRGTSKRSACHATPSTTCALDLKAVHRRAGRRLKLFDRRQVEAFGDSVLPQIPEAIGRAILRTEAALASVYARAA
jgi:DNA (cytosine-5)-methyltransferase 1